MTERVASPLGRLRVLELPGAELMLLGKQLADLGAEVIKVEPTAGDRSRSLPPFAPAAGQDAAGESLYWLGYGSGKRSVTADLQTVAGAGLVQRLALLSDVVLEAFPAGEPLPGGFGAAELHAANPSLVLTSLSPFGRSGPYAAWHGSDLVQFAMSGYLYLTGPPDGAPIKPSAPYQTWFHASAQALAATLLALRLRRRTGKGTHVDQAMRDTGTWMLTHTYQFWDLLGVNLRRQGASRDMGGILRLPSVWPARDGYVVWLFQTGHIGARSMRMLVAWMAEHDQAPAWLQEIEWETFDLVSAGAELGRRLSETFAAFFVSKSKRELFDWSLPRGVMLAPVQTLRDVAADEQLAARDAWRELSQARTGTSLQVPGPPVRLSAAAWEPRGSAPSTGQHNREVYGGLLGLSTLELQRLAGDGTL